MKTNIVNSIFQMSVPLTSAGKKDGREFRGEATFTCTNKYFDSKYIFRQILVTCLTKKLREKMK